MAPARDRNAFLQGGGQMGELIRAHDWARTPLGPPDCWAQGLKTTVRLLLSTQHPMFIWWGPELIQFYNDAYRRSIGPERHPAALGQPGRQCWAEAWDIIGPQIDQVMSGRGATWHENQLVPITRNGRREEVYWTYSYSPIGDDDEPNGIGGVLVVCTETTQAILNERRLAAERDQFAQLFEQAPTFMAMLNGPEHRFELANPGYMQLVGHRPVIGLTVAEALPEAIAQGYLDILDQVFRTGTAYVANAAKFAVPPVSSGPVTERFLDFVYQPIKDASGSVTGIFVEGADVTEQVEFRHRLTVSEESLRLATSAADVGTWDLDLTHDVLTWSERTKAMFGISADRPCSMADFYAGLHPDDLAATSAAFASAIDPAIRAAYDVEYRTIGKEDGVIRWVAAKGKGLFENDRCHRAIGTAIDITERKLAAMRQLFLLDLMDRLRRITTADAIMDTAVQALGEHLGATRVGYGQVLPDDQTILLVTCYANGAPPLTGAFPLSSFGSHNVDRQRRGLTVVYDDVAADGLNDRAAWEAIETRSFVSVPLVRDGRFGASLFVNHREPHPWRSEDVALVEEVAARLWDSIERARAEEALRQLNESLERQVEIRTQERDRTWRLAPVLMLVGDAQGVLLEANPAWTRVLGWSEAETIGHNVMEFVAPEARAAGTAGMAQLFRGQAVMDYHLTFLTRTGERRRIAWTTVPEGDRLYGHGRDVTDQAIVEEQLRQAQKMEAVGQLTGGLAHDFNNLLTGVGGSLDLLQKRISQGRIRDLERYIDAAQSATRRATALTQRLLAFSRQQTLDPKPTNVDHLVAGMEDLIRRIVGLELKITVSRTQGLWTVLVDPYQLENALLNLCINARDAMPGGGTLTIETANHELDEQSARERDLQPGQYLSLSVTDTGTGMSPETIRRAFDPFFTTKPPGAGTGLGLSMIYGFARQSGGHAQIQSSVGQGTRVTIYLPRHPGGSTDGETTAPGCAAPDADGGEKVLVVDDEAPIRMLVGEMLEDLGFAAIEAADGAAALKVLHSPVRINLLVTDVSLPGEIGGRQLAEIARTLRPDLRVLFITGHAESAIIGDAGQLPGVRVLTKPFALDALADRIRELMTGAAAP